MKIEANDCDTPCKDPFWAEITVATVIACIIGDVDGCFVNLHQGHRKPLPAPGDPVDITLRWANDAQSLVADAEALAEREDRPITERADASIEVARGRDGSKAYVAGDAPGSISGVTSRPASAR